jgi:uncharacterized glyoxalase superfamily protein PhnB
MYKFAIPVFHVTSSTAAEKFYCEHLGFRKDFAYRITDDYDPCYMGLVRDEVELHVSSFSGDGRPGGIAFVIVEDIDALYDQLRTKDVKITLPPTEQSWGNREMYISDLDGNSLRFVQDRE